jgi:hypothetical protein
VSSSRPPKAVRLGFLALAFVLAAEIGARVDDVLFHDGRFTGSPSQDDLWVNADFGRHGVPKSAYGHVRFNSLGIWGPEPVADPCLRILFIGGSETFGIPEVKDGAYTDAFRRDFGHQGCVQVFNGAIAGMTAYSMVGYYREWVSRVRATTVVVYPSTHFYLSTEAPGPRPAVARQGNATDERNGSFGFLDQSRLFGRLRNTLTIPAFIQRKREQRWIAAEVGSKPAGWMFEQVPNERLAVLRGHLRLLVDEIRRSGAEPVLVTHAVSASMPLLPGDAVRTEAMRVWMPRATSSVIGEFPYRANDVIRQFGLQEGVRVIDAAATLSGRSELFVDFVHFSEAGRKLMGQLLAAELSSSS